MAFVRRNMAEKLKTTLKTFSAVYLAGARQCGKSTFVNTLLTGDTVNKITFDTTAMRLAAETDPEGFVNNLPKDKLNVIDEIQRVPEVYLKLKKDIDDKRFDGKGKSLFLLTGSANILALPNLAKAMVGRMAVLTMYPFSSAEINNSDKNFINRIWNEEFVIKSYKSANVVNAISSATFPEIALNKDIDRGTWFDSYIDLILQRDAVEFAKIRKPSLIRQLIASLAIRVGSLVKNDAIMKEIGMTQATFERYKSFCVASYLTFEIQPWAKQNRLNKRFVKSKKIYFTDTNLLCFIMQRDMNEVFVKDRTLMGHLFENFIASEIMKATSILPGKYYVSHFNPVREDGRKETDFVIEKDNGETIAIEVKLDSTLNAKDFKNLEMCRDTIGDRFKRGIVFYTGEDVVPFGNKLWAVPFNYLWE